MLYLDLVFEMWGVFLYLSFIYVWENEAETWSCGPCVHYDIDQCHEIWMGLTVSNP